MTNVLSTFSANSHYFWYVRCHYYMVKSVFPMRLANLQSVTWTNISTLNAHLAARNLEKRFNESYKMSANLEDLSVDLVLQHFNL